MLCEWIQLRHVSRFLKRSKRGKRCSEIYLRWPDNPSDLNSYEDTFSGVEA